MTVPVATGLTSSEVAKRVDSGLTNDVPRRTSRSFHSILWANVFTLFNAVIGSLWVLILIFGDLRDGLFGLVIIANTGIGIIQEYRAKRTLDRLAIVNEQPVRVLRDGEATEIPPHEIVLDDLILMRTGDRLLVDGEATDSEGLEIDESLLTGEADPVHKKAEDEVLSGSFVVAGSGCYRATRVGREAYAARIAEEAGRFSLSHSELRTGINRFIKFITWLVIPIGAILVWSQINRDRPFADAVTDVVGGIVPMIPEGLVLITSVAFAVGVVRLGRRQCLIQELQAIEGLARVDVLCLDKTGTLTSGGMELADVHHFDQSATPARLEPPPAVDDVIAAVVAADNSPNITTEAIRQAYPKEPGWAVSHSVPFSSARKWSGVAFDGHGSWVLGAPDVLLDPGDPAFERCAEETSTGMRVLLLGRVADGSLQDPADIGPVEPKAAISIRQHIRPDAWETLRYFEEQQVTLKVISGDNPDSVSAIAKELAIPGADRAVDARTLPDDPDGLATALDENTIFGRVSPQQKRQFVHALQARDHIVAMTGDGVNDVLALKDADLGIAMGSGSGATKAVAQVVLLDDSFATMPHVVAEGRRVLANIERVANLFLTKTFYAMLIALVTGLMAIDLLYLPRHGTLINWFTIGIPAFFLALAPSIERARDGFVPRVLRFAVPCGLTAGAAALLAYLLSGPTGARSDPARTAALIALFLVAWWVLALVARPYTWRRRVLVAAMAAAFLITVSVPLGRFIFELTLNDWHDNLIGLGLGAGAAVLLLIGFKISGTLGRPALPGANPVGQPAESRSHVSR